MTWSIVTGDGSGELQPRSTTNSNRLGIGIEKLMIGTTYHIVTFFLERHEKGARHRSTDLLTSGGDANAERRVEVLPGCDSQRATEPEFAAPAKARDQAQSKEP